MVSAVLRQRLHVVIPTRSIIALCCFFSLSFCVSSLKLNHKHLEPWNVSCETFPCHQVQQDCRDSDWSHSINAAVV